MMKTNKTDSTMTNTYDMYVAARNEVEAEMEMIVTQRYIEKLEDRIAELDRQVIPAVPLEVAAAELDIRVRKFIQVLEHPELNSERLQKIKLVRAAFNMTFADAKLAIERTALDRLWTAVHDQDEDLPF